MADVDALNTISDYMIIVRLKNTLSFMEGDIFKGIKIKIKEKKERISVFLMEITTYFHFSGGCGCAAGV